MINEAEAIDAVRRFTAEWTPNHVPQIVTGVERGELDGHDCWLVRREEAPEPGVPEWMNYLDNPEQTWYVDMLSGHCIGLWTTRTWQFKPKDQIHLKSPRKRLTRKQVAD